jgi:hypothetical protein
MSGIAAPVITEVPDCFGIVRMTRDRPIFLDLSGHNFSGHEKLFLCQQMSNEFPVIMHPTYEEEEERFTSANQKGGALLYGRTYFFLLLFPR